VYVITSWSNFSVQRSFTWNCQYSNVRKHMYYFKLSCCFINKINWYMNSEWRIVEWWFFSPIFYQDPFLCTKFSSTEVVKGWLSRHWIKTLHMSQRSDQTIGWNWRRITWIGSTLQEYWFNSLAEHANLENHSGWLCIFYLSLMLWSKIQNLQTSFRLICLDFLLHLGPCAVF
jgi:hypothetical protein